MTIGSTIFALSFISTLGIAAETQTETAAPPQRPPACVSPAHRQFDFWVGSWDVYRTGTEDMVARSLIERLYDGCAIRENWMPLRGGAGGSLNSWRPDQGKWVQTWADSANAYVTFEGGMQDGAMVMTGLWKGAKGPGSAPLVRMTYTPLEDGAVRQFGQSSDDGGQSWEPFFDLTYRPREAAD